MAQVSAANGESTAHDLFALSDEQILNIEPEAPASAPSDGSGEAPVGAGLAPPVDVSAGPRAGELRLASTQTASTNPSTGHEARATEHDAAPPRWLAERMNDPWNGEEARAFWQGIQREREDAAAYRGVFAKPEEAKAAAERSRQLDAIDQLYFGAAGKSPEESAAAREQLAQLLLREDPAAFREMVFAGLRALQEAGHGASSKSVATVPGKTGMQTTHFRPREVSETVAQIPQAPEPHRENPPSEESGYIAAYAAFEKAANEDLEREVGGTIARVLEQAMPNAARQSSDAPVGAQHAAPLQQRLAAAIRQDVEAALRNDRQLAEQVALLLTGRRPGEAGLPRQAGAGAPRFDDATRAQVVRLIGERARQLVPSAAKRVLQEWTQTALGAHLARTQKSEAAASRRDVESVSGVPESARAKAQAPRQVDYRKLSDQQILDL